MIDQKAALWNSYIIGECLREANGDVNAAMSAAAIIFATQSAPKFEITKPEPTPSIPLAHDIHNPSAQGILTRTLKAIKGLTKDASRALTAALRKDEPDRGAAILDFVDRYRLQLARLLTTTQLAALLEGAREVASAIPALATFPGAVPPPPTLEPKDAKSLVERLEKLTGEERAQAIYDLPVSQQTYITQVLLAKEAGPLEPPPPPVLGVKDVAGGGPEDIHLDIIDNAVRELSTKNVLTRREYDALSAAARAKAFTVAGVAAEETLTKIRDTLALNVKEGADYDTFKQKILSSVGEGTFLSAPHMETVFRTNVQSAFSDGQMSILQNPQVRSGFPYSAYDAIHDDRVRENHLALEKHGIQESNIYRNDDPVFQLFRPPWDYNDRCSWTPITVRQAADKGIKEAQTWLDTGKEPETKAFVSMPPFEPPAGFQRDLGTIAASIQLSLQPIRAFSTDASGHKHKGKGVGGGQFTSNNSNVAGPEAQKRWEKSLTPEQREGFTVWAEWKGMRAFRTLAAGKKLDENRFSQDARQKLEQSYKHFSEAIAKCPNHTGTIFRGLHNVPEGTFKKGSAFSIDTISSCASDEQTVYGYATGGDPDDEGQTVIMEMSVKSAANIGGAVNNPDGGKWDELLIRPATSFEITDVEEFTFKHEGKQHAGIRVRVREV